jgi:hypothetical protein
MTDIFVFGSNLAGRHGAGAALEAKEKWGAKVGVGEGPTGYAYAIPTKGRRLEVLPLSDIQEHVNNFLNFARNNPQYRFLLTPIGTGYAGYTVRQIRHLFDKSHYNIPDNVVFLETWNK